MFKNLAFTLLAILAISCSDDVKPKPKGELRLDYPQPKYQLFNNNCAYTFEYSDFAQIVDAKKSCWYYLRYPKMKANVLITYFPVQNNTQEQIKEVEKMVKEIPNSKNTDLKFLDKFFLDKVLYYEKI